MALVLSAQLALPVPSLAEPEREPAAQGPVPLTGAVSAGFQTPDGEVSFTAVAVPKAEEADRVAELAADPRTVVAVAGDDDPALNKVKRAGFMSRIKRIVVPRKLSKAPALSADDVTPTLRQRVIEKFERTASRVVQPIRENTFGVLFSFTYAGGMASFNYYQSSAIEGAMAQFGPSLIWAGLLTVYTKQWFSYLRRSGDLGEKLASMVGGGLEERNIHAWRSVGVFGGSLAANSLMATLTLGLSGQLAGGAVAGIASVLMYGIAANTNSWDSIVHRWQSIGIVSDAFVRVYMPLTTAILAALEIAVYFKVPGTILASGLIALTGAGYLISARTYDVKLAQWKASVKKHYRWGRRKLATLGRSRTVRCSDQLTASANAEEARPYVMWLDLTAAGF